MEYACENEELLLEDILLMLLRAATSQSAYIALNKVKNSERRQQIKKQLFQDFLSEQELEILDLESLPILEDLEVEEFFSICSKTKKNFDEKEIFRFIVEGKEEELRNLLDENLDSNYIFSQDINMNNFLCPKGTSLLLLTLQACVKYNSSLSLYKIIALLLEKGVDLEKECLGIDPLSYLCENEDCFSKEVVLCLLTSVNKTKALLALSQVRDIKKKLELEKTLNFKNFLPCFELERSFVENIVSISELNDLSEDILLTTDSPKNDEHFLSLGDVFEYGRDKKLALKISETSQLEEALKNPIFLKKCNEEVYSKISGETFFSFIISEIKDVYKRHKICLLFLKNGYTPETIVSQEMNMVEFLCSLRKRAPNYKHQHILMETLCAIFFFFKEGSSITSVLDKISSDLDKNYLSNFFLEKNTNRFSKRFLNLTDLLNKDKKCVCLPLIKGFIEASLVMNKNMVTEEFWDSKHVFSILNVIKKKLCLLFKFTSYSQKKKSKLLLELLELLLKSFLKDNDFSEKKKKFCNDWFQNGFIFFNCNEIKIEVLTLVKKYWEPFLSENSKQALSVSLGASSNVVNYEICQKRSAEEDNKKRKIL